ncbi:unnamed protein product, partial [Owenia fusiformis]
MEPKKDKEKRSSFLDKIGGTFTKGKKEKFKKEKESVPSAVRTHSEDYGSDGTADADSQQIVNRLTDDEVKAKFEQMLDDMNLTDEKKEPLRKGNIEMKRSMIAMHLKSSQQRSGKIDSPQEFIHNLNGFELKGEKRLRLLESLRVSLTSNTVSWVQEFGIDGLNAILKNLTYCSDSKSERRSAHECVKCLKAFMNSKYGLLQIINHEEALTILARSVDPSDQVTMLEAVRILAAICLVPPDGHDKVLEGITICGEIRSQDRLTPIIMGLAMEDNSSMRVACIQLINAIISTPDDLDFRMHLRNEFMRTGLVDLLEVLERDKTEEVKVQINIFVEHKEEDFEDFSQRYENVRMELDDARECFELIQNTVANSTAEPFFLSILQHLLTIRDDANVRPQYYKLIEECVTQIVLHKNGMDPDFRHTKRFEIDVEPLVGNLGNNVNIEDSEIQSLPQHIRQKFEEAVTVKMESEARVSSLEERLKKKDEELNDIKTKVQQGTAAVIGTAIAGGPPPPPPPPGGGGPPPPPPPPMPGGGGPPPPPPPPFPGGGGPPPPP